MSGTRTRDVGGDVFVGPLDDPNRYRIVATVDSGGEGQVLDARTEFQTAELRVAIKLLDRGDEDPHFDERRVRFQRQLDLLQSLVHPGLVRVRWNFVGGPPHHPDQAGGKGRRLYIVMNWADGQTLDNWLVSNHGADFGRRVGLLKGIASAVSYLHSGKDTDGKSILHGDLKPSNVIVGDDGRIQVIDFGFTGVEHQGSTVAISGGYTAPELRSGERVSKASDIYSLGATAFALFSGTNPPAFDPASYDVSALRRALVDSSTVSLPPTVVDHVLHAMAKQPNDRPSNAEEWAKGFGVKSMSSTRGEGGPPVVPATPPTGRRWPWALAAATLAAAILAGVLITRGNAGNQSAAGSDAPSATTTTAPTVTTIAAPPPTTPPPTTTTAAPTTTIATPTTTTPAPTTTIAALAPTTIGSSGSPAAPGGPVPLPDVESGQGGGHYQSEEVEINGDVFTRSLLAHDAFCGGSNYSFNLSRNYSTFKVTAGVTDTSPPASPMRASVVVDGNQVWTADMSLGEAAPLTFSVAGALRLELRVDGLGKACLGGSPYPRFGWGAPTVT